MPRHKFKAIVADASGNVQDSANVSVFEEDGITPATVYDVITGGVAIDTDPQVQTDSNGYFEFWIDDADYSLGDLFVVTVEKGSYSHTETGVLIIKADTRVAVVEDAVFNANGDIITRNGSFTGVVQILGSEAKPEASSGVRGSICIVKGTSGVADKIQICLKKADDSYAWFDLLEATPS